MTSAFPLTREHLCTTHTGSRKSPESGMSLRDYFATHASEGDIEQFIPSTLGECKALCKKLDITDYDFGKLRAWARYQHADNMLAERTKEN